MRRLVPLLLSALIFAILVWCVWPQSKTDGNWPASQQTLVIGLDTKVLGGDPRLIGGDANSQYMESLRFAPLFNFGPKGELVPVVASHWFYSSPKVFHIQIHPNFFFANGILLTATDIKASYDSILFPKGTHPALPRASTFKNIKTIRVDSPTEVEFELKEVDASFLTNLFIGILPKMATTAPWPENNPFLLGLGYESGPFVLKQATSDQWVLSRNRVRQETSIDSKKVQNVVFRWIPDNTTRYAALIKGDVDLVQNALDPDAISTLQQFYAKQFKVQQVPKLATNYLAFNLRDPYLKNRNVRMAIAYGIDREKILKYRLHNQGLLASGMFLPGSVYDDPALPVFQYDKAKAQQFLQAAHVSLPLSLSIKVSNSSSVTKEIAKSIAADLAQIGFAPRVEVLESSIYVDQIRKGNAQSWISGWIGFKDPDQLRFAFATNMHPPFGGNRGFYSNPKADELAQKGRETINIIERKKIYHQLQQILANDEPYVYLWHPYTVAVISQAVHGFEVYADGRYTSVTSVFKDKD